MANIITYSFFASDIGEKCQLKKTDLVKLTSYGPLPFSYLRKCRDYPNMIHNQNSLLFFKIMIKKMEDKKLTKNQNIKALLYGFICHYAVDTNLTPYLIYKSGSGSDRHDKYENLEVYLSKYIVENRIGKFRTWKFSETIFETELNDEDIEFLDEVFLEAYNIENGGKKFALGLKKMKNYYNHFRYDPWGIKYQLYRFLHIFYRKRDLRNISFYRVLDQDLNLTHKEWKHPCDRNELHNDSAIDLYIHSLAKATEMIKLANEILEGKEKIEKMDEIFKDLSYVTGKKCGIDMPLKYFEE